jgi:2,3-bisphosphoglycerate-independent phosphoglycerate mutase
MNNKPLVLLILDGWGYAETSEANAILSANTPTWNKLWSSCPHILLEGSGEYVGLPNGQMGNSEVGHMTIGMGRVIGQELTKINRAIISNTFLNNTALNTACDLVNEKNSSLHIIGLLSDGGVHSHENHIIEMIQLAILKKVRRVYIHAFLDGRDTPPKSALSSLQKIQAISDSHPQCQIASLIGRYYAMDRDHRWERTELAYNLLTEGKATYLANTPEEALALAYADGQTDEFVKPCLIHRDPTMPLPVIQTDDAVIFMNFRADRARALTYAFTEENFSGFKRHQHPQLADFVTLTQYDTRLQTSVAFMPESTKNGLGEWLSQRHYRQLRIAETEKYAHVTFFFNGGVEKPFENEIRELIPSQKIATYDLAPEMKAHEITDKIIEAIKAQNIDVIIANFANADMVGHTGQFFATVKAIETIDACLARLLDALDKVQGELLITADHGNAECMFDPSTKQAHTAHTNHPVPLVYYGRKAHFIVPRGTLADIAPTMLYLLDEAIPSEMTGNNLLKQEE